MNIKELASKPKLIEIKLDTDELLERYGEPITFHTYDIVSLSTYFEFFNARSESEFNGLDKLLRKLVLDKSGKPVLNEDEDLPVDIAAAAIGKLGEVLGKPQRKASTQTVGEPQQ